MAQRLLPVAGRAAEPGGGDEDVFETGAHQRRLRFDRRSAQPLQDTILGIRCCRVDQHVQSRAELRNAEHARVRDAARAGRRPYPPPRPRPPPPECPTSVAAARPARRSGRSRESRVRDSARLRPCSASTRGSSRHARPARTGSPRSHGDSADRPRWSARRAAAVPARAASPPRARGAGAGRRSACRRAA